MSRTLDNGENFIDSDDILARIEELEGTEDEDEKAELEALTDFAEQGNFESYRQELIRESYFTDYAMELAKDIGSIQDYDAWPATCIDWEQAAEDLKQDYTELDYDGVTYYGRCI